MIDRLLEFARVSRLSSRKLMFAAGAAAAVIAALFVITGLTRSGGGLDVETVVAFPMPDRDLSEDYGQDRAYPSGFRTLVAGQPVKTRMRPRMRSGKLTCKMVLQAFTASATPASTFNAASAWSTMRSTPSRKESSVEGMESGIRRHLQKSQ